MRARSVAKLTVASTPSIRFSFFSTRAAQEAHVIPPTDSSTRCRAASGPMPCVVVLISRLLPGRAGRGRVRWAAPPGRWSGGAADQFETGLVDGGAHLV